LEAVFMQEKLWKTITSMTWSRGPFIHSLGYK